MPTRWLWVCGVLTLGLLAPDRIYRVFTLQAPSLTAATDLDSLMARALKNRDDNWKKLDQYILEERDDIEVNGPGKKLMLGDHRDYTWFVRDGLFVKSPLKANGVAIGEDERRAYEKQWLDDQQRRERRRRQGQQAQTPASAASTSSTSPTSSTSSTTPAQGQTASDSTTAGDASVSVPGDLGAFLQQTREPEFISTANFLEFKFEPGNYLLAGRETLNGRDVLRVEYYPKRLFAESPRRDPKTGQRLPPDPKQQEIDRKLNKTAMVTMWVDPKSAEIVKYVFDNLGLDFLPASWLVRISDMHGTVNMVEPFASIWLPGTVDIHVGLTLANGQYDAHFQLNYHDYRQPSVGSRLLPSR